MLSGRPPFCLSPTSTSLSGFHTGHARPSERKRSRSVSATSMRRSKRLTRAAKRRARDCGLVGRLGRSSGSKQPRRPQALPSTDATAAWPGIAQRWIDSVRRTQSSSGGERPDRTMSKVSEPARFACSAPTSSFYEYSNAILISPWAFQTRPGTMRSPSIKEVFEFHRNSTPFDAVMSPRSPMSGCATGHLI